MGSGFDYGDRIVLYATQDGGRSSIISLLDNQVTTGVVSRRLDYMCRHKGTEVIRMNKVPRISEAEWEVMRVFWSRQPALTALEVVDLLGRNDWKPTTVKTLISRLVKKRALGFRESGRVYYYYPLVTREECVRAESHSFLERVYGGALQPMLVNFIRDGRLTEEELADLKRLLEEKVK